MEISYAQAKNLTLAFLRDWMNKLPAAQRTAPTIIFDMRSWNIPDMISQVTMDTPTGIRYTNYYIQSLKQYVIR